MSNGNFPSTIRISNPHDISNPIITAIAGLSTQIASLSRDIQKVENEVNRLKTIIRNVESARASAIETRVKIAKEKLVTICEEAKHDFCDDKRGIQNDYDNTQLEVIDNFLKDANTNTKSIDRLKDEYKILNEIVVSALNDVESMKNARGFNFMVRKSRLFTQANKVIQNLGGFINLRTGTADTINNSQTLVEVPKPTTLLIPFWIIGLTDQYGKLSTHTIPIQEIGTNLFQPVRNNPYSEHLYISKSFNFNSLAEDVNAPVLINQLKNNSILKRKNHLMQIIEMKMRDNIDLSESDGRSLFLRAMDRFVQESPGSIPPPPPPMQNTHREVRI